MSESSDTTRRETFVASGPVQLDVANKSGRATFSTHDGTDVVVTLTNGSSAEQLADAEIGFDASANKVTIRTHVLGQLGQLAQGRVDTKSLKQLFKGRSWADFGRSDLDVDVKVPAKSSINFATASGDGSFGGSLAKVKVTSASGDVTVSGDVDVLEVNTASGDVTASIVRDSLTVRSASGDVRCDDTAAKNDFRTASGDLFLTARKGGSIAVKGVSGDVRVKVTKGLMLDVTGSSVTGDLGSSIDLGDETPAGEGETLNLTVTTVSGDLAISRA